MSIQRYVKQALIKSHHEYSKTTHSPSPFNAPVYGQKIEIVTINKTNPMTTLQTKLLQQVCETFLYHARAIHCTILHVLNDLAKKVKDGTQKTAEALNHFLDHCSKHPEATVLYQASNMILHHHFDTAYLVATGARLRAAWYTYFGNDTKNQGFDITNRKRIKKSNVISSRSRYRSFIYECKKNLQLWVSCEDWNIHNQPHQCRMITIQHVASSMEHLIKSKAK